jgi:hypothetical protein
MPSQPVIRLVTRERLLFQFTRLHVRDTVLITAHVAVIVHFRLLRQMKLIVTTIRLGILIKGEHAYKNRQN